MDRERQSRKYCVSATRITWWNYLLSVWCNLIVDRSICFKCLPTSANFLHFQFHDWVTNKKDRKWYRSNPEKALMVCSGFEPGAAVDEGWKAQTNPLIYDGQYNSVQFFQPIIILILCRKFTSQNWSMGWLVEWVSIIDCRPIFVKLFLTLTFCWAEDNGSRSGRVADLWHQYCKAFWSPETLGER